MSSRRRNRFASLERQFRESGGVAAPGSRLAGYIDFKKGINKITVTKKLTAQQRKRFGYAILPFNVSVGASPTAGDRYAAPITAYSNSQITAVNLSKPILGYENIEAATKQDENFFPALLRVFVASSDTKSPSVSGITKVSYNRTPGSSYSFPFGRTTSASVVDAKTGATNATLDDVDEQDSRTSLTILAKAGTNVKSVSYEPEVFRVGKADLVSPP